MPAFRFAGYALIYFAGYKKHIGLYPVPAGDNAFQKKVAVYQTGKGTLQFPFDQPLPLDLVAEVVKYRMRENEELAKNKAQKKKKS